VDKYKIMSKHYMVALLICTLNCFAFSQIIYQNTATTTGLNYSVGTPYLGSGPSFVDFDNDGWDDLTFASGDGQSVKFFKNNNGDFTEIDLNLTSINYQTKQINWVDFDNDGDKDLFVTSNTNGNRLFENTGSLNLQDITATTGFPLGNIFTNGASWADYNNDGFLDVFLCSKDATTETSTPNFLYKNNGDGTFVDVSNSAGIDSDKHLTFCSVFLDINNDGWQDIYTSNDKGNNLNQLYKNNGDGTFTEIGFSSGTNLGINAMSTTVGDYNNDGWIDIYVTNGGNAVLLVNNGDETFTDQAVNTGCEHGGFTWGAVFLDADNDSDLDLYASSSLYNIPSINTSVMYERLSDGSFQIPNNAGFANDENQSYCNAIGDFNNDGLSDVIVTNSNNQTVDLWENLNDENNSWLKIKLEGTQSNKDGIGARIELSANNILQYRQSHNGEGYMSQNSQTMIFGLHTSNLVDYLKINWPSGIEDIFYNIDINQTLNIVEGSSTLSISELDTSKLNMYPNPVTNTLFITCKKDILMYNISNILSQEIYSSKAQDTNESIDFSSYESGVYFVNITFQDNTKITKKVIKD
jgi:hypothetical protein